MNDRPTSITVIGWILIVLGVVSIVGLVFTIGNPRVQEFMARSTIPAPVQIFMLVAGMTIQMVCGVAFLKGYNWGRLLYVIGTGISIAVGLAMSPVKLAMAPGIILFAVVVIFLYRPAANSFFNAPMPATPDANVS